MADKEVMFENRVDAGRKLAIEVLREVKDERVMVLAVPNGGVPIAFEIACALSRSDMSMVISRKIPVPLNPEAGLGAIADDGTIYLDEDIMNRFGLTRPQIEPEVNRVREELKKRHIMYYKDKPLASVVNKTVVIVDDGIAAGLTMTAAVESVRHRRPGKIIVAVPAASKSGHQRLKESADKVIACAVGTEQKFVIADFYRQWYDVSDNEVVRYLAKWRTRKFHGTES